MSKSWTTHFIFEIVWSKGIRESRVKVGLSEQRLSISGSFTTSLALALRPVVWFKSCFQVNIQLLSLTIVTIAFTVLVSSQHLSSFLLGLFETAPVQLWTSRCRLPRFWTSWQLQSDKGDALGAYAETSAAAVVEHRMQNWHMLVQFLLAHPMLPHHLLLLYHQNS